MEKLLLAGLIAALPIAIFIMIAKMTGNRFISFMLLKLPSFFILTTAIIYFLKVFKII
jgi:hypothetical protein